MGAYVLVSTTNPGPREACRAIRKLDSVIRSDALFGGPAVIAIIEVDDLAALDLIVDEIIALDVVVDTETHVVRPID